jgi:hypothetical protein
MGYFEGNKPVERFGGDGLEVVFGLHPGPPRSIL